MLRLLEGIIVVLFLFWLIGLFFHLLGVLIHLTLVVILVLVIVRVIQGGKAAG
jgi:hypothetical protein